MKTLQFIGLFFLLALVSALLHEFGHCLFYWAQGIPAGMSLVKEYPLRNITDSEYAVGSLGGPLSNLVQLSIGLAWVTRAKAKPGLQRVGLAFVLANVCYFLVRSGIALLSGDGGEITDAAGLIGLSYPGASVLFLLISAGALLWTARATRLRFSFGLVYRMAGLLVLYFGFLVVVQTADRALFWERFPTIEIGEGRFYNEHRSFDRHGSAAGDQGVPSREPGPGATEGDAGLIDAGWVVGFESYGPVPLGVSLDVAKEVVGNAIDQAGAGEECDLAFIHGGRGGVSLMVVGGRLVRVDVSSPEVETDRGAKIGDSEDRIRELYGEGVELQPHKYTDGHYLIARAPGSSPFRIIFETDGRNVLRYRAGALPEVGWVEGCS